MNQKAKKVMLTTTVALAGFGTMATLPFVSQPTEVQAATSGYLGKSYVTEGSTKVYSVSANPVYKKTAPKGVRYVAHEYVSTSLGTMVLIDTAGTYYYIRLPDFTRDSR